MPEELRWRDADRKRSVLLREGLLGDAPAALAEEGWTEFELLSTDRALKDAPALATWSLPGRFPRWRRKCWTGSAPRTWSLSAAAG